MTSENPTKLSAHGLDPDRDLPAVHLGELLGELGDQVGDSIGPVDADRAVRGVEFYDPFDPQTDDFEVLLLAPSVGDPDPVALEQLAGHAARVRAPAVAIKCAESAVPLLDVIAHKHRVPFLRIPDRLSWRLFDALVSHAFGERRHSDDAHRDRGTEPLFALANELASFFGGSVAIEDLGRRVLAYSSVPGQLIDPLRTQGILTRQVPASPFNDDQYRTVLRATEPVKYPHLDNEEPRVAIAIRAGTLPLGSIWAIDASGEAPLTPAQRELITNAATVAAAHMLENLQVRKATQLPREDRCRTLLDGHQVAGSELAELGMSEERGATLLAFSPGASDRTTALAQLRSTVQRHLALHHSETVAVARGHTVFALVPHDPTRPLPGLVEPLLPIIDRLIGPGTIVALPGVAHRAGEVAALRELADRLLDIAAGSAGLVGSAGPGSAAAHTTRGRIVTVDSIRPRLAFAHMARAYDESPELRNPEVDRLIAEAPEFAETLAAWCANSGSIARAARDLAVHDNTVRYRLRQIEDHFGLPLGDPDMLLAVWLQLRADAERRVTPS